MTTEVHNHKWTCACGSILEPIWYGLKSINSEHWIVNSNGQRLAWESEQGAAQAIPDYFVKGLEITAFTEPPHGCIPGG